MAIVKLVCQGCGARLDADSNMCVVTCQYCGTSNALQHQQAPPQPRPQPQQIPPQQFQAQIKPARASKIVGRILLGTLLLPILITGFVVFVINRSVTQFAEDLSEGMSGFAAGQERFMWRSGRPFVADFDADGNQDVFGIILNTAEQTLQLAAYSGADWSQLWAVDIGPQSSIPGQPALYFHEDEGQGQGQGTALLFVGTALRAYDTKTGAERWVTNLPDKLQSVVRDGQSLLVTSIDESVSAIDTSTGKLSPAAADLPASAVAMRSDEGFELIPKEDTLDLSSNQFDDLRIRAAFCPPQDLPPSSSRTNRPQSCAYLVGVAFATRAKGSEVPYLLGYERETKAERWRVQLTPAGSLATVEGGFSQPRVIFDRNTPSDQSDAYLSFTPAGESNAHIRRFSLADGASEWEVELQPSPAANIDGMVLGDESLFVVYGTRMHILDLADGSERARLGGF
ncbi:PQQ-binding-like beta-propeller repeat protein [Pseudenhygromyxa sp. WMMC2535]|uniref:outer membrane protein assembly factor BamB family protein n=1 Tax=Pseudenhygromyxa sp. WMMC2535 TaxID=2712867 RepID=UPI0015538173|nr:PQQ-binding-like beta-propeller repeat protein [Pseudenhygromyxa sp. WMMC2535]NVB39356.1 PQQ-binding-like beta-propeller repeat protein [Pseudenhygromyxa sp. WMMC2535]